MLKISAAALLLLAAVCPAHAAIGDWVAVDHARLRLVADRSADGRLDGVIEIELDPGWKTYWRSPGEAGIAPRLDFGATTGASKAVIDFPAPERFDDGFAISNVYHGAIALPFRLEAQDAAAPVRIALAADIGVCDEICLPVSLKAAVDVAPGPGDPEARGLIDAARAALPGPGRPGEFEILSLKRVGGPDKMPAFEAVVRAPGGDVLLFAETPEDWYAGAPAPADPAPTGERRFRFDIDRKSATSPLDGAAIRLTLRAGDASTERIFHLDASGSAP